jgi:hypothetical protein
MALLQKWQIDFAEQAMADFKAAWECAILIGGASDLGPVSR